MTVRTFRIALLLAAALVLPATAQAQARRTGSQASASQDGGLHLNLLLGPEFADGETGIALRGDLQTTFQHLSPAVRLDGVFSLGYTRFSEDPVTVNLVRLVPAARFVFPVAPAVSLYGDAGIGLYIGNASVDLGFGDDRSESLFGINMRFAGGAMFDVTPTLRLGAELAVNPYFGDFDETSTTLMFGVGFRL